MGDIELADNLEHHFLPEIPRDGFVTSFDAATESGHIRMVDTSWDYLFHLRDFLAKPQRHPQIGERVRVSFDSDGEMIVKAIRGPRYTIQLLRETLNVSIDAVVAKDSRLAPEQVAAADETLSMLAAYIAALGGELEARIRVGGRVYDVSPERKEIP